MLAQLTSQRKKLFNPCIILYIKIKIKERNIQNQYKKVLVENMIKCFYLRMGKAFITQHKVLKLKSKRLTHMAM